jgi:hypothetical protein
MSRIMRRLSINSFLLGTLAATLFWAIFMFLINTSHEIPTPIGWDNSVKGWVTVVSQDVSVHDTEENRHLFWYDEDGPIRATKVEKTSPTKWIVTIEDVSVQNKSIGN